MCLCPDLLGSPGAVDQKEVVYVSLVISWQIMKSYLSDVQQSTLSSPELLVTCHKCSLPPILV